MEFGIFHSGHVPTQATRTRSGSSSTGGCSTRSRSRSRATGPGSSTSGSPSTTSCEEYSHVSANEVLMGYVAARTERIHIGSGIFNLTPPVNHPARVAERVAMLDHLSERPVRVRRRAAARRAPSTRASASPTPTTTRDLFDEALPEVVRMLHEAPYSLRRRRGFSMPDAQRAAAAVDRAAPAAVARVRQPVDVREGGPARHGRAVLHDGRPRGPRAARSRRTRTRSPTCTEPIGEYVNDNVACVSMLLCLEDRERAHRAVPERWARRTTSRSSCAGSTRSRCRSSIDRDDFTVPEPSLDELASRSTRAGAASARPRTSRGRSSGGSDAGADQLIFGDAQQHAAARGRAGVDRDLRPRRDPRVRHGPGALDDPPARGADGSAHDRRPPCRSSPTGGSSTASSCRCRR